MPWERLPSAADSTAKRPTILLWTLWRSGSHWLAAMLQDLTGWPYVYESNSTDHGEETIRQLSRYLHNRILVRHICLPPEELFRHTESLSTKVIFLYRDPRDVIASNVNMRKYHEGYRYGLPPFPDMEISEILEWELDCLRQRYTETLPAQMAAKHDNLIKVRYEDLSQDSVSVLDRVVRFLGLSVGRERIEQVAAVHAFEKRTGRNRGEEDKTSHNRKGIIGDYKNQFSFPEQKKLNDLLGDTLVRMGYNL